MIRHLGEEEKVVLTIETEIQTYLTSAYVELPYCYFSMGPMAQWQVLMPQLRQKSVK